MHVADAVTSVPRGELACRDGANGRVIHMNAILWYLRQQSVVEHAEECRVIGKHRVDDRVRVERGGGRVCHHRA